MSASTLFAPQRPASLSSSSALSTADNTPWPSPSLNGPARFLSLSPRAPAVTDYKKTRKEAQSSSAASRIMTTPKSSSSNNTSNTDDTLGKGSTRRSRKSSAASTSSTGEKRGEKGKLLSPPYRTSANASSRSLPEDVSSNRSDQWWETVLPPGRLAERLREAQAAARRRDAGEGATRLPRNATVLRNATPSDRKVWTSLADYGRDDSRSYEYNRSGANSTRSSIASIPSIKSDRGTSSTASSSGAEDGPYGRYSPTLADESATRYDRSASTSPTLTHSISRSTSSRRSRVMGDDASSIGLGIGASKANQVSVDFDDRFRHWSFNHTPASSYNTLRPFPSSATSGRHSPLHTSLVNTPEISSDEETGGISRSSSTSTVRTTTTTKTTRRVTRTSSGLWTMDAPDGSDLVETIPMSSSRRSSWNASMHSRHVSFNKDVEIAADKQWNAGSNTIGRAQGRQHSHSLLNDIINDYSNSNGTVTNSRSKPFPSAAFSRGRRTPCYSAPTSPGSKFSALHDDDRCKMSRSRSQNEKLVSAAAASTSSNSHQQRRLSDIAMLSSLGVSHSQLSSAGHIAMNVTRQLSIPLKPMLQLTMFLSISSFTCFALAGFLIAGYFITAWDDVNNRGKRVQQSVSSATDKIGAGVQWCEQLITGKSSARVKRESPHIVTAPLRFAIGVPATIAYKLTPTSISESLGIQDETKATPDMASSHGSSKSSSSSSSSTKSNNKSKADLPPRPPLSSLLPSIFLTILIAMGAGIASFFASRGAAAPTSTTPTFPASPRPSNAIPHQATPSSQIPIRRGSSMSANGGGMHRRQPVRPYDVL